MNTLSLFLQRAGEILSDPTSNLSAAALLIGMIGLVLLIVVVLLLMFLVSPSRRPTAPTTAEAAEAEPNALKRPRSRIRIGMAVGLIAVAIAGGTYATGTQYFCASTCHSGNQRTVLETANVHRGTSCISCHEDALPVGLAPAIASRVHHLTQKLLGSGKAPVIIPASRCLRCHGSVMDKTVTNEPHRIRISHAEPLSAGMSCTDCHDDAMHATGMSAVGMVKCLECHDGATASADCATCHLDDPADTSSSTRVFGKVTVKPITSCGGCHDEKSCDACHGTRMPHSATFLAYGHAKEAAFDRKAKCYKCHAEQDCWKCHQPFNTGSVTGHTADWRATHGQAGQGYCSCHQMKLPEAQQKEYFCKVCH